MLWYCGTPQILNEAGLNNLKDGLVEFVATEILSTASRLQSNKGCSESGVHPCSKQQAMDTFGLEFVESISTLPIDEVQNKAHIVHS